ncbi:unnamed protein product [Urochloa humidicola]
MAPHLPLVLLLAPALLLAGATHATVATTVAGHLLGSAPGVTSGVDSKAAEATGVGSKAAEATGVGSKAAEATRVCSKAAEPTGVGSKEAEATGGGSKTAEATRVCSKAAEPTGVGSKAAEATCVDYEAASRQANRLATQLALFCRHGDTPIASCCELVVAFVDRCRLPLPGVHAAAAPPCRTGRGPHPLPLRRLRTRPPRHRLQARRVPSSAGERLVVRATVSATWWHYALQASQHQTSNVQFPHFS